MGNSFGYHTANQKEDIIVNCRFSKKTFQVTMQESCYLYWIINEIWKEDDSFLGHFMNDICCHCRSYVSYDTVRKKIYQPSKFFLLKESDGTFAGCRTEHGKTYELTLLCEHSEKNLSEC